jgi:putative oxidoreductase
VNAILLIGRILFSLVFLMSGIFHILKLEAMTSYATYKKLPAAKFIVIGSGLMICIGALSVILGIYADLGALLLAIFVIPTAFVMHNFWTLEDETAKQGEMTVFMKDLGLGGAALILFVLIAKGADIGWALGHPAFQLK